MIIGYPWLVQHNPEINWARHKIDLSCCPSECCTKSISNDPEDKTSDEFEIEPGDKIFGVALNPQEELPEDIFVMSYLIQEITQNRELKSPSPESRILEEYRDYGDVFSQDEFNALPP